MANEAHAWVATLRDDIVQANKTELTTQLAPLKAQLSEHGARLSKVEDKQRDMKKRNNMG